MESKLVLEALKLTSLLLLQLTTDCRDLLAPMRKILMLSREIYELPSIPVDLASFRTKRNANLCSNVIKRRRFPFLGHVIELTKETRARKDLEKYFRQCNEKRGCSEVSWLTTIKAKLANTNIQLDVTNAVCLIQLVNRTLARCSWNQIIMYSCNNLFSVIVK